MKHTTAHTLTVEDRDHTIHKVDVDILYDDTIMIESHKKIYGAVWEEVVKRFTAKDIVLK
jgi:hypothetical protein